MLTRHLLPQVGRRLLHVPPCAVIMVPPVLLSGRVQPNAENGGCKHACKLSGIQGQNEVRGTTGLPRPQGWAMSKLFVGLQGLQFYINLKP